MTELSPTALRGFAEQCRHFGPVELLPQSDSLMAVVNCPAAVLKPLAEFLVHSLHYRFGSLVVEEHPTQWKLIYLFYRHEGPSLVQLCIYLKADHPQVDSISIKIHAADWHERQAEDLFGLVFTGHPRLGDFVLHEEWPEGVNPMRTGFSATRPMQEKVVDPAWRPARILETPGAFLMPIGPVYADYYESAQFFLETVGEDVLRLIPRFFFKYRGVEKLAQGRPWQRVLLMAERFSGTSAIAHATALCGSLEHIYQVQPPPRALSLRLILAEMERMRHHFAVLSDICHASGMSVPSAQMDILEEQALRLSGQCAGHRYLYGWVTPGGLNRDMSATTLDTIARETRRMAEASASIHRSLQFTSSFLDRFEGVGAISMAVARELALVGPIARASGVSTDLRIMLPYGGYAQNGGPPAMVEPLEREGDGYARIRVLFAEIQQSAKLIDAAVAALPTGPVRVETAGVLRQGAFGWAEAPNGAAFHYLRLDAQGCVQRYQIATPSFANWHGFHIAAENFAFQDFPIMMASFGLSIAESDR
ncbi:MAG: hypothetical protein HKL95_06095 [Phycisphaerae bacterium]|nr:hypothetical protein [Phycisphaerae bacterium]